MTLFSPELQGYGSENVRNEWPVYALANYYQRLYNVLDVFTKDCK